MSKSMVFGSTFITIVSESDIYREFYSLCKLLNLPINDRKGNTGIRLPMSLVSIWRFSVLLHNNFNLWGITFFNEHPEALSFLARIGVVVSESESFSFLASSEKIFSKMIESFKYSSLFKEIICGYDIENIFYLQRVFSHSQKLIADHDRKKISSFSV